MNTPDITTDYQDDPISAHARGLLEATSDAVGGKVGEARHRLAAALESGKKVIGQVKDQVVSGAKATDDVVRKNPYLAIGIAVGVGALVGFLISRRCSRCES